MEDNKYKIKNNRLVHHYPIDTHKALCCLREGKPINIKVKQEHNEKKKKFNEKKCFDMRNKSSKKK